MSITIQRALLSVYDKNDLLPFATFLHQRGIEIVSTGGTALLLKKHNIPVIEIEDFTQHPEIMEGRVKTLHPKIHGGILGRRDKDVAIMEQCGISDIDLIVVNLYPFEKVIQEPTCTLEHAIENIDIGGPALIRAAAKNHAWVTVVVDPKDYVLIMQQLEQENSIAEHVRFRMAKKAFHTTAKYDGCIANYLSKLDDEYHPKAFGDYCHIPLEFDRSLRYGENPHQIAALYREITPNQTTLSHAEFLHGKGLSHNNILDAETAITCCYQFENPTCVIVKHANPCGVAESTTLLSAYEKAFLCDPQSAFGGILAFNRAVDKDLLAKIFSQQFVEVVIAPEFTRDALHFAKLKPNTLLIMTGTTKLDFSHLLPDFKKIRGAVLLQGWDNIPFDPSACSIVTKKSPTATQWEDLIFAWKVVKFVKSNAIVLAHDRHTIGIGAGQTSRVSSVEIARDKTKISTVKTDKAVLASDAFFPFKDGVELAANIPITAIIQPGGSIRDQEVIDTCDQLGLAMVFTH
ncbi:MAG TPA: bifunctional phosphoribosylaminoimidazolecarboxamide formyltransferase/IMP cyclohydrolase, partial [Gammaproteobacteria bacterium]|nr:bifunctional phosphoribosylaminoimidazolecarboxamide formyltransferase/IMP cyclohydrolase [Gammaproteobacteria bacterium]